MTLRSIFVFAASMAASDVALAQRVAVDPFIASTLTWTSNANLAPGSAAESDLIVEVSPGVGIGYDGARLKVLGTLILDGLYYVRGNQRDRILPYADLSGTYEIARDFLYLGAGVLTYRTAENPFAIRSVGPTTDNVFTTTQYRISPYIESKIGNDVRYGVRSDNVWTHNSGAESVAISDGYFTLNRAYIERDPLPLGGGLSVEYQESDYQGSSDGLTQTLARASLRLGFAATSWVGVRGGYERVDYASTDESGAIYGIEFSWRPDSRTRFDGFLEHRFFGSAWQASINWRGARTALDFKASRALSTYSEQLFGVPTANVTESIDTTLTSQIVDPLERAREVRRLLASRGLAPSLPQAADIYSTQVNLLTDVNATASASLPRTTAALSTYYRKTVPAPGAAPVAVNGIGLAGLAFTNTEQYGASVTGGYLLSPLLAISALAAWTRIESIDSGPAADATQMSYRLALIRRLAPRTSGNVGVRWQLLRSDLQADVRETAAFVGVLHRF